MKDTCECGHHFDDHNINEDGSKQYCIHLGCGCRLYSELPMTWDVWRNLTPAQKDAQRDTSQLDKRFDGPYQTGERIEVKYQWGTTTETKRGYVGKTTGWRPVYILLNNSRSMGSSDVLDSSVIAIRRHVSNRTRR